MFFDEIMKRILLFICTILSLAQAQEANKPKNWIVGPSVGYQFQEKNFLKASFWALRDLGYANYLRFDAGANFAWQDRKAHVIPELGVTYYLSAKGVWPFVKAELTPYTVTPKLGVGLFNIVEVGAGYGFDLKTKDNFRPIKGFNFSLGLSIPLRYHLY